MESVDRQFRQQKENYEHLTEGELCALAEDAYDLTEIAREALKSVLSERGIAVRLKLEPPAESDGDEGLIILTRHGWPANAEQARMTMGALSAAGIPSFLGPDNVMHLEEFQGKFDGPVSLKIRDVDRNRAVAALRRALAAAWGDSKDPEEEKNYAILCPKCHSAEVVLEGRDSELAEPPPTAKFLWNCDACSYRWVDEGMLQEAAGSQSWPGEEFPTREGNASEE